MIVYLLLNQVNLKGYVGQHKGNNLAKRWTAGMANVKPNAHFAFAFEKYGPGAFSREILGYCSSQEETDNLERLWICVLRTYDRKYGYNMQYGGLKWRGGCTPARHTPETVQRISESSRLRWKNKTPEEMARVAEAARLQWQKRTTAERAEIGMKIRRLKNGRPSAKKGKKYGPQKNPCPARPAKTDSTKQNISEGLKRHWAKTREFNEKKPVMGTKDQRREIHATDRKQIAAIGRQEVAMQFVSSHIVNELTREVTEIISGAVRALEAGQSTALARSQLKELSRKLVELEFEYRGGCSW